MKKLVIGFLCLSSFNVIAGSRQYCTTFSLEDGFGRSSGTAKCNINTTIAGPAENAGSSRFACITSKGLSKSGLFSQIESGVNLVDWGNGGFTPTEFSTVPFSTSHPILGGAKIAPLGDFMLTLFGVSDTKFDTQVDQSNILKVYFLGNRYSLQGTTYDFQMADGGAYTLSIKSAHLGNCQF